MTFKRFENGFDQCEPPICEEDISINIESVECSNGYITVSWVLLDKYKRVLDFNENKCEWFIDNGVTQGESVAVNRGNNNFYATFNPYSYSGIIYLRIRFRIIDVIIYSETETYNLENCNTDEDEYAYSAISCYPSINDLILYVKEGGVPLSVGLPIVFKYNNICYQITLSEINSKILISEIPIYGVLIDSVYEHHLSLFENCLECGQESSSSSSSSSTSSSSSSSSLSSSSLSSSSSSHSNSNSSSSSHSSSNSSSLSSSSSSRSSSSSSSLSSSSSSSLSSSSSSSFSWDIGVYPACPEIQQITVSAGEFQINCDLCPETYSGTSPYCQLTIPPYNLGVCTYRYNDCIPSGWEVYCHYIVDGCIDGD